MLADYSNNSEERWGHCKLDPVYTLYSDIYELALHLGIFMRCVRF